MGPICHIGPISLIRLNVHASNFEKENLQINTKHFNTKT